MEKIMKLVNRVKEASKFEDEKLFHADFNVVMKGFYYTGFYRTKNVKCNFWVAFFVPLTILLGCIKDTLFWLSIFF